MAEKDVIQGFNSGYDLRTEDPKLATVFVKLLEGRKDDYAVAFIAGVQEKDKEYQPLRKRNYTIKKTHGRKRSRSRDRNKDMD